MQTAWHVLRRPLRVKVRLVIYDKDSSAKVKPVKYVKEQEVYMGELPLMTETGRSSLMVRNGHCVPVAPLAWCIF